MEVFLDANVFLYAAGRDDRFGVPCRQILTAVERGMLAATTDAEVVQEVLHVVGRRMGAAMAADAADAVLDLIDEPIAVTGYVMRDAAALLRRQPALSVRDAVHAACMRAAECTVVVSADRHFDLLPWLRRVDPLDAPAIAALLVP